MAKSAENNGRDAAGDPALPQKKRARRRLVGAVAIGVAAAVGLPLLLDSEPRRETPELKVQIPSRDTPLKAATPSASSTRPGAALPGDSGAASSDTPLAEATQSPADTGAKVKDTGGKGTSSKETTGKETSGKDASGKDAVPKSDPVAKSREKADGKGDKAAKAEKAAADKAAKTEKAEKAAADKAASDKAVSEKAVSDKVAADRAAADKAAKADRASTIGNDAKQASKAADKLAMNTAGKKYLLQVGAFSSDKGASDQADRVKATGLRAFTEKVKTADGERIRVRVGPFATREEAEQARGQLKLSGIDAALITP